MMESRRFNKIESETKEYFFKYLANRTEIYLYGAGKYGKLIKEFLEENGLVVNGFIVTVPDAMKKKSSKLPVLGIEGIKNRKNIGIILATAVRFHEEILKYLHNHGIFDILVPRKEMYEVIKIRQRMLTDEKISIIKQSPLFHATRKNLKLKDWKSILLLSPHNMGDVIMFIPLIRELRRNLSPNVKITIVVQPVVREIAELCPYIDRVIVYDSEQWQGDTFENALEKSETYSRRFLQSELYDVVFIQGWFEIPLEFLFLAIFSNSLMRIGFSELNMPNKTIMNKNYDRFLSVVVESRGVMHEVERGLYLVQALGGKVYSDEIEFWIKDTDVDYAQKVFQETGLYRSEAVVAIVPHANDPIRMWDKYKYADLLQKITKKYTDISFVILGGKSDSEIGVLFEEVLSTKSVCNLMGKTSIGEAGAILKKCRMYIGCNTGLLHIAAAWKSPAIEITCHPKDGDPLEYPSPQRYHAWKTRYAVVQPQHALPGCGATCYAGKAHCINQIEVDDVFRVFENMLLS